MAIAMADRKVSRRGAGPFGLRATATLTISRTAVPAARTRSSAKGGNAGTRRAKVTMA
jgi:hypothetical protein